MRIWRTILQRRCHRRVRRHRRIRHLDRLFDQTHDVPSRRGLCQMRRKSRSAHPHQMHPRIVEMRRCQSQRAHLRRQRRIRRFEALQRRNRSLQTRRRRRPMRSQITSRSRSQSQSQSRPQSQSRAHATMRSRPNQMRRHNRRFVQ